MTGSILEQEIYEQPTVIKRMLEEESKHVQQIANAVRDTFKYVIIAARGTSDNAARYAQYILGARNRLSVGLATPSLYTLYKKPPNLSQAMIIGISQSGKSPDIVAVLKEAHRQNRPTVAITNAPESPLAQVADHVLLLHADFEIAIAATKTYTASLGALALFSATLDGNKESLSQLDNLPGFLDQTLQLSAEYLARVERYRYTEQCAVIGRGFNYATAFEISLKVKELGRIVAEPYSSADFLHGPISMIHKGFPVIVIAPQGAVFGDVSSLVKRLIELGSELLLISDENAILERANLAMPLPSGVPEWLTPMVAVLPGQLFSMALAKAKGFDPDKPEGLSKVTETW